MDEYDVEIARLQVKIQLLENHVVKLETEMEKVNRTFHMGRGMVIVISGLGTIGVALATIIKKIWIGE